MKKTILAIAIPALFASAANAAVIYDKDGTTFDVYGRVQANYYGEHDDTDGELKGTARIGWSGTMALNNTWSALARTEWQIEGENSRTKTEGDNLDPRHIYLGFDGSQYGQFLFGQTDTAYYMGVLEKTDIAFEDGSEGNRYDSRQEGQVIYKGQWNGFFTNLSYQTDDASQDIKKGYAGSLGYDFNFGLGLSAGGERKDFDAVSNKDSKTDWAVAASYTFNGFYFAGMYNESEVKNINGNKDNYRGYEVFGTYNVDAWTFEAGYNFGEEKVSGGSYKDAADYTYLGVQYAFNSKLKAWTEYKIVGLDNKDDQWTVALQYNF